MYNADAPFDIHRWDTLKSMDLRSIDFAVSTTLTTLLDSTLSVVSFLVFSHALRRRGVQLLFQVAKNISEQNQNKSDRMAAVTGKHGHFQPHFRNPLHRGLL